MKKIKVFLYIILVIMFIPFIVNAEPLSVTDCDNNTVYTTIPSNLKGLAKIMAQNAYLDNGQSQYVSNCNGVNFRFSSSNTNGKGIYEIASTKNDTYPIYYYRGTIQNNNVKFGGFCWKAIRTTDTGGVKMIYNGEPDSNGYCNDSTTTSHHIGFLDTFSPQQSSLSAVGYKYGSGYESNTKRLSDLNVPFIYGNDVTYSNGTYTLIDTITSSGTWSSDYNTLNNNHYTCFSESSTCTNVYYIYYTNSSDGAYYITLKNGKKVSDIIDEMLTNSKHSNMKSSIDVWYFNNLTDYTNYIEDTVYCNDRSISKMGGWNPNGGDTTDSLEFSSRTRLSTNYMPSLECSRELDRFTVSNSIGNGALSYPIGLITSDEVVYAGGELRSNNRQYYLYIRQSYWTMSPCFHYLGHSNIFSVSDGSLIGEQINVRQVIRPVISIKGTDVVKSGDGTLNNPYVIEEYHKISVETNNKTEDISFNVDDTSSIETGQTITFRITPVDGYAIDSIRILDENNNEISINSTGNENEYSFIMPESNVTIIPTYKKNKFEVNIDIENETEDFDINIENLTSVLVGEDVVFKVTPIKGYKINNIKIIDSNDNEISYISTDNKNEYSFIMPESNVTIIPSYEKVSNSVNVEDNENTKEFVIEVNDSKAVVYDDIVVFKIVPEDGYEIKDIIITDKNKNNIKYEKTSNKNEYKFIMPDSDVLIKPIYRKVEVNNNDDDNIITNIITNPKTGLTIISITMILLIISLISRNIVKKIHSE